MLSFISNSDRSLRAIVAGVVVVGVLGFLPRRFERIGNPEAFWFDKLESVRCADVVVAGDSRVCRGISPGVLEVSLPGQRVVNFGFSGVGYSTAYFDAIERVLDDRSVAPIVVLGITPASLTESAANDNDFLRRLRSWTPWASWKVRLFRAPIKWCTPFGSGDLRHWAFILVRGDWATHFERYMPGGWVCTTHTGLDPGDEAAVIGSYSKLFARQHVNPASIDTLMERVERWRSRGITVFAFRPPVAPRLKSLEDVQSDFSEGEVIERFVESGGTWLTVGAEYASYDASHLDGPTSLRFSKDFGALLRRELPGLAQRVADTRR